MVYLLILLLFPAFCKCGNFGVGIGCRSDSMYYIVHFHLQIDVANRLYQKIADHTYCTNFVLIFLLIFLYKIRISPDDDLLLEAELTTNTTDIPYNHSLSFRYIADFPVSYVEFKTNYVSIYEYYSYYLYIYLFVRNLTYISNKNR